MAEYTPEFYADPDGTEPVLDWLRSLEPYKRRAATAAIEHVLARHGAGVCKSSWGEWVRGVDGIFELRIRQDYGTILRNAGVKVTDAMARDAEHRHPDVLLRIFCHAYGNKVVLLLAGYDKGESPSPRRQNTEIKLAGRRLKAWKAAQQAEAKRARRGGKPSSKRKT